jgi:hypothetical protein
VFVECSDKNNNKFKNIFASVKRVEQKVKKWEKGRKSPDGMKMTRASPGARPPDLIMIGLDSLSQNAWKRYLPKTYKYLTKDLEGITLDGYNIVGDGTPQALLPILTGLTEYELPEARRSKPGAKVVDGHPWIWKNLSVRGYASAFVEDQPSIGTFNYRMMGFEGQPTDVYGRTHFQAAGEFRDQGDAEWIVIRRLLWGHNDTPCRRPTSG